MTNESSNEKEEEYSIILTVGCKDGNVIIYKILKQDEKPQQPTMKFNLMSQFRQSESDNNKVKMKEWMRFKAEDGPVCHIRCCDLISRICTSKKRDTQVHIWEAESEACFTLEETIKLE